MAVVVVAAVAEVVAVAAVLSRTTCFDESGPLKKWHVKRLCVASVVFSPTPSCNEILSLLCANKNSWVPHKLSAAPLRFSVTLLFFFTIPITP